MWRTKMQSMGDPHRRVTGHFEHDVPITVSVFHHVSHLRGDVGEVKSTRQQSASVRGL